MSPNPLLALDVAHRAARDHAHRALAALDASSPHTARAALLSALAALATAHGATGDLYAAQGVPHA